SQISHKKLTARSGENTGLGLNSLHARFVLKCEHPFYRVFVIKGTL
ncbi:28215_t:CDS:1, partial [Gigaspora margarita]